MIRPRRSRATLLLVVYLWGTWACASGDPGTGSSRSGTKATPGAGAAGEDRFGNSSVTPSGGGAPYMPPEPCASTLVHGSTVVPTVILIVDQSSSMTESFGGGASRWNTLRDFLLDEPDGLIASLQNRVRFGLALYSAESGGEYPDPIGECPMVTSVAPATNNFAAIADVYRQADVIEDTPTGDSIDKIVADLGVTPPAPDEQRDPIVFVVATDGEPDRCTELDPQNGQQETIDAVSRAYALGIHTFIISVGEGTVSAEHQQGVANAGLGRGPNDVPAQYWVAGDDSALRKALGDIVGAQLTCDLSLDGEVVGGDPCDGTVTLNGAPLTCNDPDGWELADPRTIRLLGAACERLKNEDVLLEVSFPCTVTLL
jgi:hypothetical protein